MFFNNETISPAQALHGVGKGFEDDDLNPWERIEVQDIVTGKWKKVETGCHFDDSVLSCKPLRISQSEYEINGRISKGALDMLKLVGGPYAEEILMLVENEEDER